jgi:branched-chain amino acid aminotransferase
MFNQTLHYGNGVFEGIRAYSTPAGTKIFKPKEHFQRLRESAKKMHIRFDYTISDLIEITNELLKLNKMSDAYIRPVVFSGINMKLLPTEESTLFIGAWKWGRYLGNKLQNVTISSYERPNPRSCPIEAKITGNYVNSILATYEAKKKGFDEALLLDMNGNVAEGPGTNFFFEKDGVLFTAPLGSILAGITRATVIEMAKDLHMEVKEKLFKPDELMEGDSAFFTGTAAEVAGIGAIDGYQFPLAWDDSMGYILSQKYRQLIRTGDYSHSTTII